MKQQELIDIRTYLKKTQSQMAHLLGISLKAVQAFEQGWRNIPTHVERQAWLLLAMKKGSKNQKPCWTVLKCPTERKANCPAWELGCENLCWFINGTICQGKIQKDWKKKMKLCRKCKVFISMTNVKSKGR